MERSLETRPDRASSVPLMCVCLLSGFVFRFLPFPPHAIMQLPHLNAGPLNEVAALDPGKQREVHGNRPRQTAPPSLQKSLSQREVGPALPAVGLQGLPPRWRKIPNHPSAAGESHHSRAAIPFPTKEWKRSGNSLDVSFELDCRSDWMHCFGIALRAFPFLLPFSSIGLQA